MLNEQDHAVVVGISRYPELRGPGSNGDLRGPVNDVEDVLAWLQDPRGGAVPEANIRRIVSPATPEVWTAAEALPTSVKIDDAVRQIADLSIKYRDQGSSGRRLYIYVSGHGFAPNPREACLYTANCTDNFGDNVVVTSWLEWFQDAGNFRELVLWMDCCMDRSTTAMPNKFRYTLRPSVQAAPTSTFIALAAPRPLRAVEGAIADDAGRVHGLFTWTLLEGLRGAAADANGRVTGRSLGDWLRNATGAHMSPGDRNDDFVAKEPEIPAEEPAIIFGRGLPARRYPVELAFPGHALGAAAKIWSGLPPMPGPEFPVTATVTRDLEPGLYLVEVAADGPRKAYREPFEVVGRRRVDVKTEGDAIDAEAVGTLCKLVVEPGNSAAEVFVVDARFSLVDKSTGRLETQLRAGLYKIKARAGRTLLSEPIIFLDRDCLLSEAASKVSLAAPLPGTASTHRYQEKAVAKYAGQPKKRAQEGAAATLTVMARAWSGSKGRLAHAMPWVGVTVVDGEGRTLLDLERANDPDVDGELSSAGIGQRDPYAIITVPMQPGTCFLRQTLESGLVIEQAVTVPAGWGASVYLLRSLAAEGGMTPRRRLSIQLRDLAGIYDSGRDDTLVETARIALADERSILTDALADKLFSLTDPWAGIIGGHLLLLGNQRHPERPITRLDGLIRSLRALVGDEHPDVEALSLRCPDQGLRRARPLTALPSLERSWRLVVKACDEPDGLVPPALWQRAAAVYGVPLYHAWAADEVRRDRALAAVAKSIFQPSAEPLIAASLAEPTVAVQALPSAGLVPPSFTAPKLMDSNGVLSSARLLGVPRSVLPLLRARVDASQGSARPAAALSMTV